MKLNKKALVELAKSFARFVYFGVLGLVAVFLTSLASNSDLLQSTWTVWGVTIPVGVYVVAGIGFVTKSIDLYVRKNKSLDSNGIAPKFLQN